MLWQSILHYPKDLLCLLLFLSNLLLWVQSNKHWSANFQSLHIHTDLTKNSHQFNSNLQIFLLNTESPFIADLFCSIHSIMKRNTQILPKRSTAEVITDT